MSDTHHKHAKRSLSWAFGITAGFMVVEAAGGILTGSLALLSDSAHMLTDSAALGLSLLAARLGEKPVSSEKSFGYRRIEVLAALANGLALWAIAGFIAHEAYQRFFSPRPVSAGPMLAVAVAGFFANLASAFMLEKSHAHNINVRGALLHVMTDLLGSAGVITAAVIMMTTGWTRADPLISAGIVLLVLYSSWELIGDAFHILMEGTPPHIRPEDVREALSGLEGVLDVHELHIWALTPGFESLSAHLLVSDSSRSSALLKAAHCMLEEKFGIDHCTLQIETELIEKKSCVSRNL